MAENLPLSVILYFVFMGLMLSTIFYLSISTLISTSRRIETIRNNIMSAPYKVHIEERVSYFRNWLSQFESELQKTYDRLKTKATLSEDRMKALVQQFHSRSYEVLSMVSGFKSKFKGWQKRLYDKIIPVRDYCDKFLGAVATTANFTRGLAKLVDSSVKYIENSNFNQTSIKLLLPPGATLLTQTNFDPKNHPNLPIRFLTNNHEYLATDPDLKSSHYEESPVKFHYEAIQVLPAGSQGPKIYSTQPPGSNISDIRISFQVKFDSEFQLNYSSSKSEFFIHPYEVITPRTGH